MLEVTKPPLITDGLLAQEYLATRGIGRGVMRGIGRYDHAVSAGGGASTLADIHSSACCELDATRSDSYSGSGTTWANRIASPADGAAQTDWDFDTSTISGSNPTFTGSAGSSSAYWALDGNDCFDLTNFSSTAAYTAHHSGASGSKFTIFMCYAHGSLAIRALWGSGWLAADAGIYAWVDPNGNRVLYRGTGSVLDNASETDAANDWTTTSQAVCVAISADMTTTTNNVKFYTLSSTPITRSKNWGTVTTTASNRWLVGATSYDPGTGGQQGYLPSGAEIYAWAYFNDVLSDSVCFDVVDYFNTQHARTYWSS